MKTSLRIGRIGKTEIRLHISLLLLIPYVLITFQPSGWLAALLQFLVIILVFACILLHELGHTLVSKLLKIEVKSITLWPLGGFANLERQPDKAWKGFLITAAGPLVNLVLAGIFFFLSSASFFVSRFVYPGFLSSSQSGSLLFTLPGVLALLNLYLAVFNLIPLYPMDGGQIFRSAMEMIFNQRVADLATMIIGFPLVLILIIIGIWLQDPLMLLISLGLAFGVSTLNQPLIKNIMLVYFAVFDRGSYYRFRHDYDSALRYYNRLVGRYPGRAMPYFYRSIIFLSLLDYENACADANTSLRIAPNHILALCLRAEIYAIQEQYAIARDEYNHILEIRPDWGAVYVDRASVYIEQGDIQKAQEDLHKAGQLNYKSPLFYILSSMVQLALGNQKEAAVMADMGVTQFRDDALVFPEFILPGFKNHLEWARFYYGRAIQKQPKSPAAYQGSADAARVNEEFTSAVIGYTTAIRFRPRHAELYLGRGKAYLGLGERQQAADDFQQARTLATCSHLRRWAEEALSHLI